MSELLFIAGAGLLFALLILCCWHVLPRDRWQVLACIPVRKNDESSWRGVNLTMYGALTASAATVGILFVLILTQAAGCDLRAVLAVLILMTGACVPASRLVAIRVEKKRHTFTIGGAFFCGLLLLPLLVLAVNRFGPLLHWPRLDMEVVLAAVGIGYILGEGLGRLACLSFGCCYGKPLARCGRLTRLVFGSFAVVFSGATKKAVYEGKLAGEKLVPVQGVTCLLYTATALLGTHFFLHGHFRRAFLLSLVVSQAWRVASEALRADFRGFAAFSAYQKMGLAAIAVGAGFSLLLPHAPVPLPDIGRGLARVCSPSLLLGLQLLWLGLFLHYGRSMVTSATLSIQVLEDRI